MMNNKGFFFFKFESRAGLDTVLEGGPWLIRKTPIILKTWTVGTRLLKEEMSRIPIWVKFHDIFGHTIDHCPLNVGSATNVNTSNVVNPPMESVNDGFQKVTKKKKNRGKSKSAAGYKMVGPTMRYEPKAPKNDLKKIPPLSAASGSAHQNNTSNVDSVGKLSSDVQNMS
ncbi:zinc knuckle CX2CX4HX4C containing protein [Tanacetum coccineum]